MKKILCTLLVLTLILGGVAGCKKTDPPVIDDKPKEEVFVDDKVGKIDDIIDNRYKSKIISEATFDVNPSVPNAQPSALALNAIFSSGMVLQRNTVNCIYGKTTAQNIAVKFDGVMYYGTVNNGLFEVYLDPQVENKNPVEMICYTEREKIILTDIYVGEVIICAGQSNMDTTLGEYSSHAVDVMNSKDKLIRLFNVKKVLKNDNITEPTEEYTKGAKWYECNPQTSKNFSAVGYLYGKNLRETLDMPIGLIGTAIGGSGIAYWLPEKEYAEMVAEDKRLFVDDNVCNPSKGYNGMIYQLRKFAVRGVIWYQGETDAMNYNLYYEDALTKLLSGWRREFDNPTMIWTIMELPRWGTSIQGYSEVREDEKNVADKDQYAVMSTSIDLGEWGNIHPGSKTAIAKRASDETLYNFFGVDSFRCPKLVKTKKLSNQKIELTFVNVYDGLVISKKQRGFEVFCAYGQFQEGYTIKLGDKPNILIFEFEVDKDETGSLEKITYGINPYVDDDAYLDLTKQLCIFNSKGMPQDQFIIKLK